MASIDVYCPEILIPKFIESKDSAKVPFGVWGEYELIKKTWNALSKKFEITQHLKFKDNKNIIVDGGLKRFASLGTSPFGGLNAQCSYLCLGSGTSTPVSTDVKLQALGVSGIGVSSQTAGGSGNDWWIQNQWDIGLSTAIGTWTEVGCTWSNASTPDILSRNLFKDSNGNPVSVQKTSSDTLTIVYKLHIKRSSDTPFSNVIAITGGTGNITVESLVLNNGLQDLTAYGRNLNYFTYSTTAKIGSNSDAITPTLTGVRTQISNGTSTIQSAADYITGNMYRDFIAEWPAAPVGTIYEASIAWSDATRQVLMFRFVEGIPKDNTKKFRLNYRINYGRAA